MRYAGQGWEIPVDLPTGQFEAGDHDLLAQRFVKAYEEFFGRAIDDLAIETVSWSVRVSSVVAPSAPVELSGRVTETVEPRSRRSAYDAVTGRRVDTAVIGRDDLWPNGSISGPAIIAESQTTTVIGSHHVCAMQSDGSLLVTRDRSRP